MFFAAIVVLMPKSCEPRLHSGLQDLADVHLGEAHVAVRVALDVVQLGEILGIEIEHEPFGDDRDAVAAAVAQTLDDRADQRVDDGLELDLAARRTPPGSASASRPAALPMPSARWPALRPIAMTKYQRDVVFASTIRFLMISTP